MLRSYKFISILSRIFLMGSSSELKLYFKTTRPAWNSRFGNPNQVGSGKNIFCNDVPPLKANAFDKAGLF